MLTLYSYPELFGVADNNGYGLKIFAVLKLAGLPFAHQHVVDTSAAPRGQLPYIVDDGKLIGDSGMILTHLKAHHDVDLDAGLTRDQRDLGHMITRMLDDLYWVMSYSRWSDEEYWPQFRDHFLSQHHQLTAETLDKARDYNAQRYFFQGIGRYKSEEVYARGLADLRVLARRIPDRGFLFGESISSVDAAIYGFLANSYFYDIHTPLKAFICAHPNLVRHCETIHSMISEE